MTYLLYLSLFVAISSRPTFRDLIPNAYRVPCPEGQEDNCIEGICEGVGHLTCQGGGERNLFGQDFQSNGFAWTKELCKADSDGDGLTNGQELGDPCCTWVKGMELPEEIATTEVSHPGFSNSILQTQVLESPDCTDLSFASTSSTPAPEAALFESEGDNLYVFEYYIKEHAIPKDLNSYFDIQFNFPMNDTYDIIAMEAIVDNKEVLHHFLSMACDQPTDNEGVAIAYSNLVSLMRSGCIDSFYGWGVGGTIVVLPSNAGFRIGKDTSKQAFNLNVHYNNPKERIGIVDGSGVRLYMTTKLREVQMDVLGWGGIINLGEIPPGRKSFFSTTFCQVSIDKDIAPNGIELFSFLPHAHYIGRVIISEKVKRVEDLTPSDTVILNGTQYAKIGYVAEEWNFDYNNQQPQAYKERTIIQDGDLIATTCVYDSTSRTKPTYGGELTEDEMCISWQMYTPRGAVKNNQFGCILDYTYTGNFPEGVSSIVEVPLNEPLDYEEVVEKGILDCDSDYVEMEMQEACPDLFKDLLDIVGGNADYECSEQCAIYLYTMLACQRTASFLINVMGELQLDMPDGDIVGADQNASLGSGQGSLLGDVQSALQSIMLDDQFGDGNQSASFPSAGHQGGLQNIGQGNLASLGGQGTSDSYIQPLLQSLMQNPLALIPYKCNSKIQNYIEEFKFLEEYAGHECELSALSQSLSEDFEERCGYVEASNSCSRSCAEFIANMMSCQADGIEGLDDVAAKIQEEVGVECADVILAFQI
eukprot:TRINITY_DN1178_c0_g1_i2.p1 TRINITY_DN1178_c0_g1~~TRINITY_DN1178_c0_g1_i2.p1  ORF type:complete len:759 (-),score=87.53 TRINITY_DN1178_c0_g1_i2:1310-3586(-)